MSIMYTRLVTALKTAADASGDLLQKILLGTPGSYVEYPAASPLDEQVKQTYDTGGHWSGSFLPPLLEGLGDAMDRAILAAGFIATQGAGVTPVVTAGSFIGSATKDEVNDRLTVNFDPAFAAAPYFVTGQLYLSGAGIPEIWSVAAGSATIRWHDPAGGIVGINSVFVMVLACGLG